MLNKTSLVLVVSLLALSACQTTSPKIGNGPITLSSKVTANFENYKSNDAPTYFVVANDGSASGYQFCPPQALECYDDGGASTLKRCNDKFKARGTECSLFAIGRKIVWKGPVSYRGGVGDFTVTVNVEKSASPLERGENIYFGVGVYSGGRNSVELRFKNCVGSADLLTRQWAVSGCLNNYSAKGTLREASDNVSFRGFGIDSKGNKVELKLIKSTGRTAHQKPAHIARQRQDFPAALSARVLCQFALTSGLPPKWNTDKTEHVSEAKRRGFSVSDCEKHAGKSGSDTSRTQAKSANPLSIAESSKVNAETAVANGLKAVSEKDYLEAIKWFRTAANEGNSDGENYMGFMRIKGFGVSKDYGKALEWLQKAADKNHSGAILQIGYLHVKGWGVDKNFDKAIQLFRKLAEQGYAPGQNRLGLMYKNGWGVSRDYDEAKKWFRKGADQGHKKSKRNLEKLQKLAATNQTTSPVSSQGSFTFQLYGKWEGVSNNVTGIFSTNSRKRSGKLSLNLTAPNSKCSGQWVFAKGQYGTDTPPEGAWSVACTNGLTASGMYTSHKRGQGLIEGEDNQKRKINMYFN
jgi:TPR repeat protein